MIQTEIFLDNGLGALVNTIYRSPNSIAKEFGENLLLLIC